MSQHKPDPNKAKWKECARMTARAQLSTKKRAIVYRLDVSTSDGELIGNVEVTFKVSEFDESSPQFVSGLIKCQHELLEELVKLNWVRVGPKQVKRRRKKK